MVEWAEGARSGPAGLSPSVRRALHIHTPSQGPGPRHSAAIQRQPGLEPESSVSALLAPVPSLHPTPPFGLLVWGGVSMLQP